MPEAGLSMNSIVQLKVGDLVPSAPRNTALDFNQQKPKSLCHAMIGIMALQIPTIDLLLWRCGLLLVHNVLVVESRRK
jgi:hypothetical protein